MVVDSQPSLVIGAEGDPAYEFSEIVAFGRLRSGGWYVADRGTSDVRYYDEAGALVRRVGRYGEGPGEFQYILGAWPLADDGVLVYDAMRRRLTRIDGDGDIAGTSSVAPQPTGWTVPVPVGFLEGRGPVLSSIGFPECVEKTVAIDTVAYLQAAWSVDSLVEIARIPGGSRWGNAINILHRCLPNAVPFAGAPIAAARSGRLYIARRDRREITIIAVDSASRVTIPGAETRLPLTQAMIGAYIDEQLRATPRDERGAPLPRSLGWPEYERRLRETPYPDSLPAADQLLVDPAGRIWLGAYPAPGAVVVKWWVIDPFDNLRQELELPASYRLTEIGPDYIAAVAKDSLDVQRVVVHQLSTISN